MCGWLIELDNFSIKVVKVCIKLITIYIGWQGTDCVILQTKTLHTYSIPNYIPEVNSWETYRSSKDQLT
jgi:hypothetical protein